MAAALGLPMISTFTLGFKAALADIVFDAHGDHVVAGMQGFLDVENRLRLPVVRFADELVVHEKPAVVVTAAKTNLHAGIVQVLLGQREMRAENRRRCSQILIASSPSLVLALEDVPG